MGKVYFKLDSTNTILIYGAGGLGREIARRLLNSGYKVEGFIDKNADCINAQDNLKVYSILSATEHFSLNDTIVIVCLHNALWHSGPAKQLYEKGFQNIIFLPIDGDYNVCEKKRMEAAYDSIKDGVYENVKDIPSYKTLVDISYSEKDGVIEANSKTVTVWMEICSIYSNDVLKERGNDITKRYGDVSVSALKPYIEMYKYCEDGNGDIGLYCYAFKGVQNAVDDVNLKEFVDDRIELYDVLKQELNSGMDYFIQSAPLLKWNYKQKHFNVHEGHHRLLFLLSQGLNRAPVKITVEDYNAWVNKNAYEDCLMYIKNNNINKWITPINHPGLYYFTAKKKNIYSIILSQLHYDLATTDMSGMNVVDYSGTGGYFSRALKSRGCNEVICNVYNENKTFVSKLNKLFYYDDIVVFDENARDFIRRIQVTNIAIINLSIIDSELYVDFFEEINNKVIDFLMIECLENTVIDKYILTTKFRYKKRIKRFVTEEGVSEFWLLSPQEIKE